MKEKVLFFLFLLITFLLLSLAIKGQTGNPIFYQSQGETDSSVGGPFESSGSNSRYALTQAIVEDKTFFLNEERAAFSAPDIVYSNGKYFSLFTPGVSFLGIPFYIVGKSIGLPQLITFLSTAILAFLNFYLIIRLATKFGANSFAALISGFIFLFTTNAFSYSLTYVQHHASVTLILFALLNSFGKRTLLKNTLLGFLFGAAILVDIPNIFIMSPILIYVFLKHFRISNINHKLEFSLKLSVITLFIGMIPLITLFGWYNYKLTGSYFTLGQNIGRTDYPAQEQSESINLQTSTSAKKPGLNIPFNTRLQLNGFYILLLSNERGIFFYSPIISIGVLGFLLAYKSKNILAKELTVIAIAVILTNVVLYSMFGDPWGGWAFGPRYLIPSAAILSAGVGLALQKYRKNFLFAVTFFVLITYSLGVNTLGAMTTILVPPKVEAVNLQSPIPYTYQYNLQLLDKNLSSSLFYNLYLADKISPKIFLYGFFGVALGVIILAYIILYRDKEQYDEEKVS